MNIVRQPWIPLVLIGLLAVIILLAPAERTLGDGIRWVYVHVGLVWAGGLGLGIAAALGLGAVITNRAALGTWTLTVGRAGLAAFGLGIVFSMVAASVNWGAVSLWEPRMAASLRFLAVAVILQVVGGWAPSPRVTGLLAIGTAALLFLDVGGAPLVMHPRDPVRQASSSAIQATFAASFAIATSLLAWGIARTAPARSIASSHH
ncbi:MAG TPA: hypothetical protein VGR62_14125 [Candidatus Binatia bacterium]|jgi:hypothetical protein|nr:hypothetical protein [Candidatus Binatia bacterium]